MNKYEVRVVIGSTDYLTVIVEAEDEDSAEQMVSDGLDFSDLDIKLQGTVNYEGESARVNEECYSVRQDDIELIWTVELKVIELD